MQTLQDIYTKSGLYMKSLPKPPPPPPPPHGCLFSSKSAIKRNAGAWAGHDKIKTNKL